MKTIDWKPYLEQYHPEKHASEYEPLKYVYAIKQTNKAILFKLKNHVAVFIPKSALLVDHKGFSNIGKRGWVYVKKWTKMQILKEYADKITEI